MKHTVRNDILLIAGLLLIAGVLWYLHFGNKSEGAYAVVYQDGEEIGRYPLGTDTVVMIPSSSEPGDWSDWAKSSSERPDIYNILVIEDGAAYISEASCPGHDCVKQGKIQYAGQTIICLPNSLVVEIVGGEESGLDAVAG